MATNELQGSVLLTEFSTDGINYKVLVCAQSGKIDANANVNTEKTKCGPIKSVDDPDWKMNGTAVANFAPSSSEWSLSDVMGWIMHKVPIWSRVQSPPHDAVPIGADYYREGKGYFSSTSEDISNGSVVKFDWNFEGEYILAIVKTLGIYNQPDDQTLAVGSTISLSVEGQGGTPPYTYQWKKGGVNITGATASSYTKGNAQTTDTGSYTVVITDAAAGTVTSSAATVTVS